MFVAVSLDTQEHSVKEVRNIFSARSLDFLIIDHTRSEKSMFFFQNGLFPRLKGTFS